MSTTSIKWTTVNAFGTTMSVCANKLFIYNAELEAVQRLLSSAVSRSGSFNSAIDKTNKALLRNSGELRSLNTACRNIVRLYQDTEKKLTTDGPDTSTLNKFLENFGVIGPFLSALFGDGISAWKSLLKFVGAGASLVEKGTSISWQALLGFTAGTKMSFMESLGKQVGKWKWDSSGTVSGGAHNVGAIAKWGGALLSGVTNLIGNYDEFDGDTSNPRMWQETALETAVDVGVGVLVSAAVGTIGAPAVVAGVITTAIVIGADHISKELFDVDLSEAVSDAVLNVSEAVSDVVNDAVGKVADTVTGGFRAGWKAVFG